MTSVKIQKTKKALEGTLSFPGDKSLSHRALIFGSLSEGTSCFTNVLQSEDCICTREAFEAMGVTIQTKSPTEVVVEGRGLRGLHAPKKELYLGNSGTSIRLLLGVLAGQDFEAVLTGDPSLSKRPMRRVTDPLRKMGAKIEGANDANFAPLRIKGGALQGSHLTLPMASAQVKSAILLAGLYAKGQTSVTEPLKSRDHTERFLSFFGAPVDQKGLTISIGGGQTLHAQNFEIAGDISSAAFFAAIATLVKDSQIHFRSVLWNPTRIGILEVLKRMGMTIKVDKTYDQGPETVADFKISSGELSGVAIKKEELPAIIDEIPILTVLATQAKGTTVIHDAKELRVKETDRIHSMVTTLSQMGANIKAEGDTIIVRGPTPLKGAKVSSFRDHRTAMSLIVAGMIADGETTVEDVECIKTSFPNFFDLLGQIGVSHQRVSQ